MYLYDVCLSSLATSFGLRICRVLILFAWVKCFHCFVCWWPVLSFIRICVYMNSLYFYTMLYVPYACILVRVCNYVCTYVYVLLEIFRIVYCFQYSECQESPITQEINCTAYSSTCVRIQKMSKNNMPNVTWNRKNYVLLWNAGITSS